jgi:hypothetical protein
VRLEVRELDAVTDRARALKSVATLYAARFGHRERDKSGEAEPDSARELLVVNQKDCPVNLSLTQYGLVVVKRSD